jgi:regulator of cell morphogenesis and NO signaling
MADAVAANGPSPHSPFGSAANPIRMMENEHEFAGGGMARTKTPPSGYVAPDDACNTYRVCLEELKAFETDLHRYVHLENNILFPKARAMEVAG